MKLARAVLAFLLVAFSMAAAAQAMPNFDELKQRLKIRPEQEDQYDMAVGASKRALLAVGLSAMEMKQRLAEELMKPRPDFSRLADSYDQIVEQHRPLFKAAGEEWRKLYDILDDEQVDIARRFLRENLGRLFAAIPDSR